MLHNSVLIHSFFYKNTPYKNTEARFAQKIRTSLEHAQLQMRNLKEKQFAVCNLCHANRTKLLYRHSFDKKTNKFVHKH